MNWIVMLMGWMSLRNSIMNQVEELREELKEYTVAFTQLIGEYASKTNNQIFCLVEGKDDPAFYRYQAEKCLSQDYHISWIKCCGKKQVKATYDLIDWEIYSKDRILFFMDRDLSDYVKDESIVQDVNVYITDYYSIENNIACKEVFDRILEEVLGPELSADDRKKLSEQYESQRILFENEMLFAMANIIYWKNKGVSPANYKNIKIKKLISVSLGKVSVRNQEECLKYIYESSQVPLDVYDEKQVLHIMKCIKDNGDMRKVLRGKYLAEFFALYCTQLCSDSDSMGLVMKKRQVSMIDFFEVVAPRCVRIESLRSFWNRVS